MIFDTDILIWVQRGSLKAAHLVDKAPRRLISAYSYLELMQDAKNKAQQKLVKKYLSDFAFEVLPLSENIGHRAMVYIEEYGLTGGLRAGDAIIAATSVENNQPLASGNIKHFRMVKELDLRGFHP